MRLSPLYLSASFLYLFEYFLFFLIRTVSVETFYYFSGEHCSFSKRQESGTQFPRREPELVCQATPHGLPHSRCPECLFNKLITLVQFHTHIYLPSWGWKTQSLKTYIKTAFERGNICCYLSHEWKKQTWCFNCHYHWIIVFKIRESLQ